MSALAAYQPVRELGEGHFSKVTLVKCHCKSFYAMKSFKEDMQIDGERAKVVQRDLQIASSLKHRHLVKFTEFIIEEKRAFIIMNFCEAGDLYSHLHALHAANKSLTELQIFSMFVPVCVAVLYLHENHLIHRNISSRNVFLDAEDIVKLGDYGLATLLDVKLPPPKSGNAASVGTLAVMAPELWHENQQPKYNEKVDVWGLGCLLHEMCALQVPFEKTSMEATMRAITVEEAPRVPSKYSEGVQVLIDKMLRKNPVERLTVGELLQDGLMQKYLYTAASDKLYPTIGEVPATAEQQALLIRKLTAECEQAQQEIELLRCTNSAEKVMLTKLQRGEAAGVGAYNGYEEAVPLGAGGIRHRISDAVLAGKTTTEHFAENVKEKVQDMPHWLRNLSMLSLAFLILLPLLGATFAAGVAYLLTHSHLFGKRFGLPEFFHMPHILDHLPHLENVPVLNHLPGVHHHEEEKQSMSEKIMHGAMHAIPDAVHGIPAAGQAAGHAMGHAAGQVGHAAGQIAKALIFPSLMWAALPLLASLLGCLALFLLWRKAQLELKDLRGGHAAAVVPTTTTTRRVVTEEVKPAVVPQVQRAVPATVGASRDAGTVKTSAAAASRDLIAYKDLGLTALQPSQTGAYSVIDWATLKSTRYAYATEWQKMVTGEDKTVALHFPPLILERQTAGERCVILLFLKRVDLSLHLLACVVQEQPDYARVVVVQQPLKVRVELTLTMRDSSVQQLVQERVVAFQSNAGGGGYQTIMTLAPVQWTTLSGAVPPRCLIAVTAAQRA